jgi:hypothetical protein
MLENLPQTHCENKALIGESLGTRRFQRALGKRRIGESMGILIEPARWKRCVPRLSLIYARDSN